ncbi:MAG: hypothetical protein OES32_07485 [Acidobacteriota bacterium]|nr:hypothetical protein [Acidobacteriota bacterium]
MAKTPKKTVALKRYKKVGAKRAVAVKPAKLRRVSTLPKAELAKLKLDDLWVLEASPGRLRARLCGCRNVCLA